jgi:hypothetical protein
VRRIDEFLTVFPEAALHRQALQLLGSDWVYAAPDSVNDQCWVIHIRFGQVIENLFDITREVVAYYSPYDDLQTRTYNRLEAVVAGGARNVTPDIRAVYSRDPETKKKLRDWTQGAVTTLPIDLPSSNVPDAAARLFTILAEFLSTRDLYYETLPVTGDDFFGRRLLLLSLIRDISEHRVCGIFGLRKSGKTSVVREVIDSLGKSSDEWALAFVDLETLPDPPADPLPTLLSRVRRAMLDALQVKHLRTHELKQLSASSSVDDFGRAMKACLGDSDKRSIKVLLALDEVEFMLAGDLTDERRSNVAQFLAVLRSLVQEHESFLVLFSGITSSIVDSGKLFGRPNPFYSWAKPYFVAPLQRDELADLVGTLGRRMALDWSDEALEVMFTATDGHPFYARTLASSLVTHMPPRQRLFRVEKDVVSSGLPTWRRAVAARVREIFETLETYYPDERTLLDIAIESAHDLEDIALEHPTEVEHLVQLGLLTEDEGGSLTVGALAGLHPSRKRA